MNKKIAIVFISVSLVLVTLVLVFYLQFKSKIVTVSPVAKSTPPSVLEEISTWDDPAEFSFQYPKSLSLNPHNEDQVNYAHVELTSVTHLGSLIVWVKDTTADTIDNWVSKEKIKNSIDSNLDGLPAKKVFTTGDVNKVTISAVRNGYLYQIEVNPTDSDFWNKILEKVTSSFKFTSSEKVTEQKQTPDASNGQGPVDVGGSVDEEVIE